VVLRERRTQCTSIPLAPPPRPRALELSLARSSLVRQTTCTGTPESFSLEAPSVTGCDSAWALMLCWGSAVWFTGKTCKHPDSTHTSRSCHFLFSLHAGAFYMTLVLHHREVHTTHTHFKSFPSTTLCPESVLHLFVTQYKLYF